MAPFFCIPRCKKLQGVSYPLDNVCHFSEFRIKKKVLERAMTFYYLMKKDQIGIQLHGIVIGTLVAVAKTEKKCPLLLSHSVPQNSAIKTTFFHKHLH